MNRMIGRLQLVFLAIFAASVFAIWAYQSFYVTPQKACEQSGNWWDPGSRTCGHVVYLPDITHRVAGGETGAYPGLPSSPGAAAQATSLRH